MCIRDRFDAEARPRPGTGAGPNSPPGAGGGVAGVVAPKRLLPGTGAGPNSPPGAGGGVVAPNRLLPCVGPNKPPDIGCAGFISPPFEAIPDCTIMLFVVAPEPPGSNDATCGPPDTKRSAMSNKQYRELNRTQLHASVFQICELQRIKTSSQHLGQ